MKLPQEGLEPTVHRELLGELSRAAAETAKELLAAAAGEEEGFRPGVVSVVQTFGDRANFHPHVHALVTRGGWDATGEWIPVAYVDERAAEELFRHKVLALLRRRGLLSLERVELLLSWRRSGFSVHNRVFAHPADGRDFEVLVRYMMRSPVSLSRLRLTPGAKEVSTPARAAMTLGRPRETSGSTPKSLWRGSWSRYRTPDATWCATTGPTRTGPGGSAERRGTRSSAPTQASLFRHRRSGRP